MKKFILRKKDSQMYVSSFNVKDNKVCITVNKNDAESFTESSAHAINKTNYDSFELLPALSDKEKLEEEIRQKKELFFAYYNMQRNIAFIDSYASECMELNLRAKKLINEGVYKKIMLPELNTKIKAIKKLREAFDTIEHIMTKFFIMERTKEGEEASDRIYDANLAMVDLLMRNNSSSFFIPALIMPDEQEYIPLKKAGIRKHERITGAKLIYDEKLFNKYMAK